MRFLCIVNTLRTAVLAVACQLIAIVTTAYGQSSLFTSVNGTGQNSGGLIFRYTSANPSTFLSSISRPRGLAFDSNGNFYIASTIFDSNVGDFQGTVFKVTPDGVVASFAAGFSAGFFLEGLALDGTGNLFVIAQNINDPNSASTIYKISPNGATSPFGVDPSCSCSVPGAGTSLVFDNAGNLFASSTSTISSAIGVYKFASNGNRTVFVSSSAFISPQGPTGMTFDTSGNLFVSTQDSSGNGQILTFTPAGQPTLFATGLTNVARGLAFDSSGNLFVAEVSPPVAGKTGDILKFTQAGQKSVFASGLGGSQGNGGAEFLAFQPPQPPAPDLSVSMTIAPVSPAHTSWNVSVRAPANQKFSIQTSQDLVSWQTPLASLVATGAVQTFAVASPGTNKGFFRLLRPVTGEAYSWDLVNNPGPFGVLVIDASNRYVATELVDRPNTGGVIRNTGLYLIDPVSGSSLLLKLGSTGYPSILVLDQLAIEFLSADPTTRQVTWQVRNAQGQIISPARTDVAPPEFFGISSGPVANERSLATTSGNQGPTIGQSLSIVGKGTLDLVAVAGTNAGSPVSVAVNTAGVLVTPFSVAADAGMKQGAVISGTVWGVDAAQCGTFLAEAAAVSTPATAEGWIVLSAQTGSGLLACKKTVQSTVDMVTDLALQGMQASALAQQYLTLAQNAEATAGNAYNVQIDALVGQIVRTDSYFTQMNLALAMLREDKSVIDNDFPAIDQADQLAALSAWNNAMGAFLQNVDFQIASAQGTLVVEQSGLSSWQAQLPIDQQCCADSGGACCDNATTDVLVIQELQNNITVLQAVLQSLTSLKSSAQGIL
jgi:hypothetical protein